MNPHCECPVAGYCKRHQMTKSSRKHELCRGTANSGDCGTKYWNAWEQGKAGAVAPKNPIIVENSFCGSADAPYRNADTVSCCGGRQKKSRARRLAAAAVSFASTLGKWAKDGFQFADDREVEERRAICATCPARVVTLGKPRCSVCECFLDEKTALRVSSCPIGKWFVERPARELHPQRNLLYFVGPVRGNEIWQWNVAELRKRIELFDGVRSVAVALDGKGSERRLDSLEAVKAAFDGVRIDHWLTARNGGTNHTRESLQWRALLETVKDQPGATFFGHTKGVTREKGAEREVCRDWTQASYETCLDDPASVSRALSQYSMAGPFKRYGMFAHTTHKWHYSGTFFWFRNDDVFGRKWAEAIRQHRVGVEAWPGWLFAAEETACLFADDCGNPYDGNYWKIHLLPLWANWRRTRR